ncbi:MAG: hypothetical protein LBF71_02975, partial [Campylobacteraceae bacterium]|nr:hypothetical protein [Campylobacteraceae bacterium]
MFYKIFFFILIFVSIATNIYFASLLINIGSATDNAYTETLRQIERNQVALLIIQSDWIGQDISKLNKLINKLDKETIIVNYNNNSIELHDIVFTFSN